MNIYELGIKIDFSNFEESIFKAQEILEQNGIDPSESIHYAYMIAEQQLQRKIKC